MSDVSKFMIYKHFIPKKKKENVLASELYVQFSLHRSNNRFHYFNSHVNDGSMCLSNAVCSKIDICIFVCLISLRWKKFNLNVYE